MKITVIGAGNSGLAMSAHLSSEGHTVIVLLSSSFSIEKLLESKTIHCQGIINDKVHIDTVTYDMREAVKDPDIILVTTPANSHKDVARNIGENINKKTFIVLNPGRTFGALEFKRIYEQYNFIEQTIAETQTIIYTCRKTGEDSVNILSFKSDVLISTFSTFIAKYRLDRKSFKYL